MIFYEGWKPSVVGRGQKEPKTFQRSLLMTPNRVLHIYKYKVKEKEKEKIHTYIL